MMDGVRRGLCALALLAWPLLAAAQERVPEVRFTVSSFEVSGENPLGAERTRAVLAPYAGDYTGLDGLLAAADALEQALAAAGHGLHRVSLPPQTLEGGRVTLKVVRFVLGQVVVEGNQRYAHERIRAVLPALVPGHSPNADAIARDVAVANRNPAKTLSVSLRQGEAVDTVDAVVNVRERKPWMLFGLLDNTGTPDTGRSRVSVGGQYSDLFGLDHVITATATRSPQSFDDVRQYGLSYQIPVYPLSAWLTLSWVRSDVDSGTVAQFFDVSGSGSFWSARLRQDLARVGALRHGWSVSLQDRKFDNNVSFLGAPIGTEVRSRPITLGWDGTYVREAGNLRGYVNAVQNLGGGEDNDDAAYNAVRAGAERRWNALRFGSEGSQRITGEWFARARVDAQWAGETLIPGEQIGLGGASSIRGFEERAVSADNGFSASLEVWSPPIRPLAGLRLLGFVDGGYKDLERPQPGEEASDVLLSVGLGARLSWRENLSISLDWGRVLEQAEPVAADTGNNRWHLSVLVRY